MFGRRKKKGTTEHTYVEERLSAYLDGELTSQERSTVERHLAGCQACRWNLETMKQTVQWTLELPTVPVPRVFTVPIPAAPARAPRWRWTAPVFQVATAMVALLLVFVVAGDLFLTSTQPGTSVMPAAVMEEAPAQVSLDRAAAEPTMMVEAPKSLQTVVETVAVEKEVEVVEEAVEAERAPAESPSTPPPGATVALGGGAQPTATQAMSSMSSPSFEAPAAEEPAEDAAADAVVEEAKAVGEGEGATGVEEEAAAPVAPPPEPAQTAMMTATALPTEQPQAMMVPSAPAPAEETAPTGESAPGEGEAAGTGPVAPTVVAAAREEAASEIQQTWQEAGSEQDALTIVLRLAEITLLIAFVVLLVTTLVITIQRRRSG